MDPAKCSPWTTGVRVIAVFEAAKGALAVLMGVGLLSLVHRDVQTIAERLLRFFHCDPAGGFSRLLLDAMGGVTDIHLWLLAVAAFVYAVVRAVEAYCLWNARAWAEWFALGSASLYLPIEIYHLWHRSSWFGISVFLVNLVIVAYLACVLRQRRVIHRALGGAEPEATLP